MTTTVVTPNTVKPKLKDVVGSAFTMPVISPLIVPPPYRYRNTKALNILFKTDAQILPKLVPAPLTPVADQPLVFYIGYFQFADYDLPYYEAGLLAPITYKDEPGLFAVVLYLDKANPVVGGREIYGWPKKDAEAIWFAEEAGKIKAGVTRYGKPIIAAEFDVQQKVEAIAPRPKLPLYFLKVIPSIEKDASPDVAKLNSMVIDPDVITQQSIGKGSLHFGQSPWDPLGEIPVTEVTYSELIIHDFTLGFGHTVFDYLKEE